jgi:predicted aldo/keto reductase-like oxidoreductase
MVDCAYRYGMDYFFFYSFAFEGVVDGLGNLCKRHRHEVVVATGEEARDTESLIQTRDRALQSLGTDFIDIFYAEYVSPDDSWADVKKALDTLSQWKQEGTIRYVGVSAHDRQLAGDLVESGSVDVLMHRHNMAHRKSESTALPRAMDADVPVVAFTCTRWGSLLRGHPRWSGKVPTASDCYRFSLGHDAVRLALTAPGNLSELDENIALLEKGEMSESERLNWSRYGDLVYGDGTDAFETRWP